MQSGANSLSGAEPVYVTQDAPVPMPMPNARVGLGTGQGAPESQRLATLNLESVSANQRELIERSMSIGGVSFANDGYNARVNAQREKIWYKVKTISAHQSFFSMDFSHQLPSQPGQALLTFGSREAKANAEIIRQRHLQQTTQQQPSQQQQLDQEHASSASSEPPYPPLQTMTKRNNTINIIH